MSIRIRLFCVAGLLALSSLSIATVVSAKEPVKSQLNPRHLQAQIAKWEQKLTDNPDKFDYEVHNELRHLYGAVDLAKSMTHTNIILKNCPMDDYMLNILSSWEIGKDETKAVESLLDFAAKYPGEPFVVAACTLKAADLTPGAAEARVLYAKVAEMTDTGLDEYQKIAKSALKELSGLGEQDSRKIRKAKR